MGLTVNEVENELSSILGDGWEWTVDFVTNRSATYGGSLDRCQNDYHSPYYHKWKGVTVDMTWYADLLTKAAAMYIVWRIGLKKAAEKAWYTNLSATTIEATILWAVKNDTYSFVAYEGDTNTWGDYYWPHYWGAGGFGWKSSIDECETLGVMTGHPASDKSPYYG